MLRTEGEIRVALEIIQADERLKEPTATVDINAPLALVQMALEAQIKALKWVLKEGK